MKEQTHSENGARKSNEYRPPELVVHGTVAEVTRGTAQGNPDGSAAGSTFPDGNTP
jgi:hypothetical protein